MVRLLVALFASLLFVGSGAIWYGVSSDRWPWDDRATPAAFVWTFNAKLGRFLYDHGQDPVQHSEGLTKQEQAEVQKVLAAPQFKDREFLTGQGARLTPVFRPMVAVRRG